MKKAIDDVIYRVYIYVPIISLILLMNQKISYLCFYYRKLLASRCENRLRS